MTNRWSNVEDLLSYCGVTCPTMTTNMWSNVEDLLSYCGVTCPTMTTNMWSNMEHRLSVFMWFQRPFLKKRYQTSRWNIYWFDTGFRGNPVSNPRKVACLKSSFRINPVSASAKTSIWYWVPGEPSIKWAHHPRSCLMPFLPSRLRLVSRESATFQKARQT